MAKNQFISGNPRARKFDRMVDRISEVTGVDHKFIRKSGEKVLDGWEEKNHKKLSTLFTAHESFRRDEINKMAKDIQRYMEPKVDSGVAIKKIKTIAEFWLGDLYKDF